MAVYYKFKSAKDFDTVSMDGPFISVGTLKERIFESKHLGRGTDFDLMVTNAQTNEDYNDEDMIPKNTSVLIRRVPGRPRMPIVREQAPKVEDMVEEPQPVKSSFPGAESSTMKYPDDSECDEFGYDLYSIPEAPPAQPNNPIAEVLPTATADEDSKIQALIDTPALDWQRQGDGFGAGRGFGRGMGGRMMGGRGFGLDRKTPPQGYICHRCKVPGHFIQHCPTNGDPNFDIKRVKPPTGIPKSMLMATPDGSYALPSGAAAVLRPNEAAFEKEIEGLPSTRSVGDLPPELHCPLCKEVMKDAVLTSKCCFNSFCDKCIRDYIISKSVCVCGATNVLADDLLPNKTVRDTINRILESGNSSTDNAGSTYQVQDMESKIPQHKIPSPTASAASKGEQRPLPNTEQIHSPNPKEPVIEERVTTALQQTLRRGSANDTQQLSEKVNVTAQNQALGNVRAAKVPDASEATHESMTVKEPASQGSVQVVEEEVQQKVAPGEAGKKKKKKKVRAPVNDFQWKNPQDLAENYMMPMGPSNFNPYWGGMQPGMEGFGGPFAGAMPYMGYGMGPLDMPFGGMMPQDPFAMPQDPFAMPGYMMPPVPHQRNLAEYGMGMNARPPVMSKDKFDTWKSDAQRWHGENERRGHREFSRDREIGREFSSGTDVSSMKSKTRPVSQTSGADYHRQNHHRSERSSPELSKRDLDPPPRPPKRKYEHSHDWDIYQDRDRDRDRARLREPESDHERDHHRRHHHHRLEPSSRRSSEPAVKPTATAENKKKISVFSRISFPEGETSSKKRKGSTSTEAPGASSSSVRHKSPSNGYHDDCKSSVLAKAGAVMSGGGRKTSTSVDYESSDDDRHFKRKPSRYEPSPPPQVEWEDDGRHSRGSRERDRKHR